MTCVYGYAWITLIPIANVLDSKESIDRLDNYLQDVDPDYLEKQVSFGLEKGQSCFCPLGYIPVVIGLPAAHQFAEDISYNYVAILVYPILDLDILPNTSPCVLVELKGWMAKVLSKKIKLFKNMPTNHDVLEQYVSQFPEKPPSPLLSPSHDFQSVEVKQV